MTVATSCPITANMPQALHLPAFAIRCKHGHGVTSQGGCDFKPLRAESSDHARPESQSDRFVSRSN